MMPFAGLQESSFKTYSQEKWSSMVHNLARMKTKDAMLALCDQAAREAGDELVGLTRAASDEIPNITNHKKVDSQWVYWFRGPEERTSLATFLQQTPLNQATIFNIAPQDKHAILAVIIREAEIWTGFRLAPGAMVDRRNLASKLGKAWERERLIELLAELPEGATLGFENNAVVTVGLKPDALAEYADHLGESELVWSVGHTVSAAEAIEFGVDLADHVGRWLGAFAPIYRFAAWSRDNDFIGQAKQAQEEKAQKRRKATSYEKGDKVRVVGGLFAGKLGVVESTDTKAQVKVRIGKMSVVLAGTDLTPAN